MRRLVLALTATLALTAGLAFAQTAGPVYPLPNGWQPEGIAKGPGKTMFVGSIPTGRVLALDVKTGQTTIVVPQREGRAAIGLKYDRGRLFVAGGPTGHGYVYDARTGRTIRDLTLTTAAPTFVNDVVVTKQAAWFTDSRNPQLYRLGLKRNGSPNRRATAVPITGDLKYDDDPNNNEVNGIAATRNGKTLIVVQSTTGLLFRVDAKSGLSKAIPITGGDGGKLPNADGILLDGITLFVVQNRLNKVALVALDGLSGGSIESEITHPAFDVPTTVARRGQDLYLPNARFGTPPSPDNEFAVIRVPGR